jgi:CheY-like chemotaxis protein
MGTADLAQARILVVDDEPANVQLLQSEKVATMRAFDLILSDTKMRILDGEPFYAGIEQRFPGLRHPIVFVTGDILSREKREFLERTSAPHILRPFDLREVRQVVHMLVDAGGGARRESGPGS